MIRPGHGQALICRPASACWARSVCASRVSSPQHAPRHRPSWWAKQPREKVFAQLRQAEQLFLAYAAAHPDCAMMLDYEGLVSGPDYIRGMHDFLGEPMDRQAVEAVLARSLRH